MTMLPTGPWVRLTLVGLRVIRPTDDLAIDDPLAGWCLEARTESGVAFRRLPPRGLAPKSDERSLLAMLLAGALMALGFWKLFELAALAIAARAEGG